MVNPPIQLGTLGMSDTLILMIMALVVFGPRRLPQIGRQIGKLMYEFRKASNDFKFQMEEELRMSEEADRRKKEEAERAQRLLANPPAPMVEAQPAVGAQESVSAPSHPLYGSGYPDPYPPDTAATPVEEPPSTTPRIQPPSTGAPVPARRGATAQENGETSNPAAEEAVAAEANIGAVPASIASEPAQHGPDNDPASTGTETVSHHG